MNRLQPLLVMALAITAGPAAAQALHWQGAAELRLTHAATDEVRWPEGGLGKARTDGSHDGLDARAALAADLQLTPALLASASARWSPDARQRLDLLDAWLRWRPVSTTAWRGALTAGMFFPPISLENDAIGWTSPRTLTPSAINTWVGEELRTFGLEGRLEHRATRGTLVASLALFQKNDPAGELLATRGWALHDSVSGLDGSLREPDSVGPVFGTAPPVRFRPFLELDHRLGAYAAVEWQTPARGRARLLAYDNRADPAREVDYAGRELYGWRTRFWSAGAEQHRPGLALLAQVMRGSTVIEPAPGRQFDTRFAAGYLLVAREGGAWQPAVRLDLFQARQTPGGGARARDEHGHALTAALNWRPDDRFRLVGEVLHVDSTRNQRRLQGLAPRQREWQLQASARWFF